MNDFNCSLIDDQSKLIVYHLNIQSITVIKISCTLTLFSNSVTYCELNKHLFALF